jgi:hypothetical protein
LGDFDVSSFEDLLHILHAKTADAMLPRKLLVTATSGHSLQHLLRPLAIL